ncbi:unnamed protein product, partial [Nesidiocoris tenuis]
MAANIAIKIGTIIMKKTRENHFLRAQAQCFAINPTTVCRREPPGFESWSLRSSFGRKGISSGAIKV